jgi:hypothetical protein
MERGIQPGPFDLKNQPQFSFNSHIPDTLQIKPSGIKILQFGETVSLFETRF